MLTAARLREVLNYDTKTGVFTWRTGLRRSKPAGSVAGSLNKRDGRIYIRIDKRRYSAHRLAWMWMRGRWPKLEIDHKNCNPMDNSWGNLREATRLQNSANLRKGKKNISGYKGVSWHAAAKKWQACISIKNKNYGLGLFTCAEEAHAAYVAEATRLRGEFARVA